MKPKNYIKGVNEIMDRGLARHNATLKVLIAKFEFIRRQDKTGVKMSMPKVDTLNGDGRFENLDGKGVMVFEYEIKREITEDVWIKTRKLRALIETDIIIQAYEGSDIIRTFTSKDVDRGVQKTETMWQPSTQTHEYVTSVKVTKFKEHKNIADLVSYIKEVI